jgi:chromosome segregation ATPase
MITKQHETDCQCYNQNQCESAWNTRPIEIELQAELDACKGNLILMTEDRDKWLNQTIEDSDTIAKLQAELSKVREANTTYLKAILSSEPEKTVKLVTEIERLKEENHELLLADTKNTEICEKFEADFDSLLKERNHLAESLVQANLDIIRLEKRNEEQIERLKKENQELKWAIADKNEPDGGAYKEHQFS